MTLSATASKFGGRPFLTDVAHWPRIDGRPLAWLGLLNFAEMRPHLDPLPERGLLSMWFDRKFYRGNDAIVCRWFPEADERDAAVPLQELPPDAPSVTWLWEAALLFEPRQWLADSVIDELVQLTTDAELSEDLERELSNYGGGEEAFSQEVLPPMRAGIVDRMGEQALHGRTLLYALDYENAAGFSWGTNTFYLHIADEDLARGDLDKLVCAVANS